jgi:hypothetical protein
MTYGYRRVIYNTYQLPPPGTLPHGAFPGPNTTDPQYDADAITDHVAISLEISSWCANSSLFPHYRYRNLLNK